MGWGVLGKIGGAVVGAVKHYGDEVLEVGAAVGTTILTGGNVAAGIGAARAMDKATDKLGNLGGAVVKVPELGLPSLNWDTMERAVSVTGLPAPVGINPAAPPVSVGTPNPSPGVSTPVQGSEPVASSPALPFGLSVPVAVGIGAGVLGLVLILKRR